VVVRRSIGRPLESCPAAIGSSHADGWVRGRQRNQARRLFRAPSRDPSRTVRGPRGTRNPSERYRSVALPRDAAEDAIAKRFAMHINRLDRLDRFEAEALARDTASRYINGEGYTSSSSPIDPRVHKEDAAARAIEQTLERVSRIDSRLALGLERTLKLYAMLRNRPGAPREQNRSGERENGTRRRVSSRLRVQDSQDRGGLMLGCPTHQNHRATRSYQILPYARTLVAERTQSRHSGLKQLPGPHDRQQATNRPSGCKSEHGLV
jgi:hypothetical protein